MRILVCIKEALTRGDINRFDTFALEQALLIKELLVTDTTSIQEAPIKVIIDVITLGDQSAEKVINRAYGMGADNGIHIQTDIEMLTPFVTASTIAVLAKKNNYDLILTGMMSEDMMAGQTGPMLAEMLKLPCATGVVKTRLPNPFQADYFQADSLSADSFIQVEREMEHGFRDCLELQLPCVLAIQAGSNIPRYPTLSNMLAASKKKVHTVLQKDLVGPEINPRQTQVSLKTPEKTRAGKFLEGSLFEKIDQLRQYLKNKDLL